ncbi:nucleotidyl transferase AbiEii/AbiGii toxin family protein [Candidatus Poriferisodalis sp.]|uniref:nucleotidyl transferase AbiEii/AbiGii toxin family protein n=1 Tax=Candidatus Poriferisodalis sp. TaxID=3101277 RepID=UPI003B59316B
MLDVAQDYALHYLHEQGIFGFGVVLKGGTSLRKLRAGNAGRFSTDLDFAAPDAETAALVLDTLDNATTHDVAFRIGERGPMRGHLEIDTPLGRPAIASRIEVSARPLWLPAEDLTPVALPVHSGYEFDMPAIPTPTLEEAIAEKLAAWRRRAKVRDLYDLYWYGQATFDESLVRRLLVLKAWHDTVDDKLGNAPFEPADLLDNFDTSRLPSEDIGLLTQPAEPQHWLNHMITRFSFLAALDGVEAQIAACSPRDRRLVNQTVAQLAALHEAAN